MRLISLGLGVSTAAETLICMCRPYWFDQAMRPFSHPTRHKCGQRPSVILGVFTVFGWLAASRHTKAGKATRRQAGRRGSMGRPCALDSQPRSHCRPYLFAGYPSGMPSKAFSLDIRQQKWPKRPETGTDIQPKCLEMRPLKKSPHYI